MSDLHKVRITMPEGRTVLGRVEVDGQVLRGVTAFATGDVEGMTQVHLTLFADLEIEGEAEIVKEWQLARTDRQPCNFIEPCDSPAAPGSSFCRFHRDMAKVATYPREHR